MRRQRQRLLWQSDRIRGYTGERSAGFRQACLKTAKLAAKPYRKWDFLMSFSRSHRRRRNHRALRPRRDHLPWLPQLQPPHERAEPFRVPRNRRPRAVPHGDGARRGHRPFRGLSALPGRLHLFVAVARQGCEHPRCLARAARRGIS